MNKSKFIIVKFVLCILRLYEFVDHYSIENWAQSLHDVSRSRQLVYIFVHCALHIIIIVATNLIYTRWKLQWTTIIMRMVLGLHLCNASKEIT